MASGIRTIGVSTGGGDAPGLNAVIRGLVRAAVNDYGWRVVGVTNGFDGLIWPEHARELTEDSVSGILPRGGTILGTTNRGNPFSYHTTEHGQPVVKDFSGLCLENMKRLKMDALVVIGGDGTLSIANKFFQLGMKVVGVPKTIDNDLSATEVTFGFDTALQVATDALDRLHTTAESHHRVMLLEVMGRDAGWIALHAGIAGGAHVILIPEIPFTIENIVEKIRQRELSRKKFSLIVVAEGAKLPPKDALGKPFPETKPGQLANAIAFSICEATGRETRVTVLGHIQRGGSPSPFDRILATRFGVHAADLIAQGEFGKMVCLRCGKIMAVPLQEAIGVYKTVDATSDYVRAARGVGISFGDRS
ncbi:MAG: ATP-dependent 6-phosphofructokinase [Acidobacteria bacterium]|nr:ATP-dependent 6-phosphofructokinase [Acidobacteriota bacterium]MCL5287275.1 ATP-dependent 6-phosphofructokinase [Acidobacteriota bacterium]